MIEENHAQSGFSRAHTPRKLALGPTKTYPRQIAVDGNPRGGPKRTHEMEFAEPGNGRDFSNSNWLSVMRFKIVYRPTHIGRDSLGDRAVARALAVPGNDRSESVISGAFLFYAVGVVDNFGRRVSLFSGRFAHGGSKRCVVSGLPLLS